MKRSDVVRWGMLFLASTFCLGGRLAAADDAGGDELVQMAVKLIGDKDKDMRALGFQQVREESKGAAATKRFAALLPNLPPEVQIGLLDALSDRGDNVARPALLPLVKSHDEAVRVAALRALGSLGEAADVPLLVQSLAGNSAAVQTAAQESLVRLRGAAADAAIAGELSRTNPKIHAELIDLLASRRSFASIPSILPAAEDADAGVRMAAMLALGQLAGPENIPEMLNGVLRAKAGSEREAAERAVALVCLRIEDPAQQAKPLLAAVAKLGEDDKTTLLPTLGRVGGADALGLVEAAITANDPRRRDAGIRALCNWPDASVAAKLLDLTQAETDPEHRTLELRAVIRLAAIRDKRSDAARLDLLKKAMALAASNEERNLVLKHCQAIRTIESLRFVVPYLDRPPFAQDACATVVDLARHRELRLPNEAEFDKALDTVIHTSKDAGVVDRAERYKKGQT